MEAQLAAYRARKMKEHSNTLGATGIFKSILNHNVNDCIDTEQTSKEPVSPDEPQAEKLPMRKPSPAATSSTAAAVPAPSWFSLPTALKCLLWLILWGLFIELQFGAVYFIVSMSYVIYVNMRSGEPHDGQPSAYSVFNPGFERLDGTLTAEQFEREIRFGAASVH